MTINVYEENGTTVVAPEGKIDHVTVEEFENKINELGETNDALTLDMAGVEYVSSAALRAILNANDLMEGKGGFEDEFSAGYRCLTHRLVIDPDGNTVDDTIVNLRNAKGDIMLDTYYEHP